MLHDQNFVECAVRALFGTRPRALSKLDAYDANVIPIRKFDGDERLVFGEVYAPGYPDSQGDFMTPDAIRKMAYDFMMKSAMGAIDTNHNEIHNGSHIVENFIARKCDDTFIPGAWVVGVKVAEDVWPLVKSGDLNGFSLDGMGIRKATTITMNVPDILKGDTSEDEGHNHVFFVKYDAQGRFLGGQTSYGRDGHFHLIKAGTVTERVNGHSHRFSAIDSLYRANVAMAA